MTQEQEKIYAKELIESYKEKEIIMNGPKMLQGFNYVEYLKRHHFIGQIDPWRRHDNGNPVLCLLTAVEPAINECEGWSGQELKRGEFIKYLKDNDIFVFRSVEEFKKYKDEKIEEKLEPKKRNISDEHRRNLQKQVLKMNEARISKDTVIL